MQIRRIPLKKIIFLFLVILYSVELTQAETYTVSSTGDNSDQKIINDALRDAFDNPGSTVYLKSSNGPFVIDGQIQIGSNTKLTGDSDTVVKVSKSTTQFFVDGVGVFGQLDSSIKNIEIWGFTIDGNCDELPRSFANSGAGDHNAERLMEFRGTTTDFGSNIKIHDMTLIDAFSDAVHIYFSTNVNCYNNFISNCQHSSIFYVCCFYSAMYNNEIFGITSDCARLDSCQNCKIYKNIFYSYTGDNSNGAYQGGQNGLQVGDQGHSHGGGSDKPYHTTNIEVYENIFANCGRTSIWIDAAGKTPSTNLYIHDNKFVGVPGVKTDGVSVNGVNVTESSENISYDNLPSQELSEKVFSSIFDILDVEFPENATTTQTAEDFNYTIKETENGKVAGGIKILGFNNWIVLNNQTYISSMDDTIVKTSIIQNPSLVGWSGGVSDVQKAVNISIENNTVIAVLTAKVKWYNLKTNSEGKNIKKYKTSEYNFSDTYYPAPNIFEQPDNINGIIYQYPTYFTLSVPSNGLTKLHYEYKDNSSEHIFLVGTRNYTENGVMFTEYSELEHWEGNLQHQGKWIFCLGQFNENKLKVTAYTPFKKIGVKKFDLIKVEYPGKIIAWWVYPFIITLVILLLGIRYMWKQILF
jgi:hypothetical protein